MDEEVLRLIANGLLVVIALLLIVAVARLERLHKKLQSASSTPMPEASTEPEESGSPAADPQPETETPPEAATEDDGPFERDGRWWYRRAGELLVYDDRTEQWVDPDAQAKPAVAETQQQAAAELHPLEEARGWDTAPVGTTPPPATPEPASAAPEPAGAAPEPASATTEPASAAPIPEPVEAPAPIAESGDESDTQAGGHWKCPACGVINGSTATSCRMCFSARP